MSYSWLVSATYLRVDDRGNEHRFIFTENESDVSPYDPTKNCWNVIAEGIPTKMGHGRLERLSLIGEQVRYDFDVVDLPDVVPVHEMAVHHMLMQFPEGPSGDSGPFCTRHVFGYRYVDEHGGRLSHTVEVDGPGWDGAVTPVEVDGGVWAGEVLEAPAE